MAHECGGSDSLIVVGRPRSSRKMTMTLLIAPIRADTADAAGHVRGMSLQRRLSSAPGLA